MGRRPQQVDGAGGNDTGTYGAYVNRRVEVWRIQVVTRREISAPHREGPPPAWVGPRSRQNLLYAHSVGLDAVSAAASASPTRNLAASTPSTQR